MRDIPPHAKRVFKGVIFDVYHWPQEMFDGTTETWEAIQRPATVDVLAMDGDTLIFNRQQQPDMQPFYSLFGGRGEEGEEPLVSAKRELLEESGLESDDWRLLRTYGAPGKLAWASYLYVAKNCRTVAAPNLDAGEKIEILRMPLAQFITDIVPHPDFRSPMRNEIMSAFDQQKAAAFTAAVLGEK